MRVRTAVALADEMAASVVDSATAAVMAQTAAAEAKEAAAAMAVVMVEARERRDGVEGLSACGRIALNDSCAHHQNAYFRTL